MRYSITAHIAQEMPRTPNWISKRPLLAVPWRTSSLMLVFICYCGVLVAPLPCVGLVAQIGFAVAKRAHSAALYWSWAALCFGALAGTCFFGCLAFCRFFRVRRVSVDGIVISAGSILAILALAFYMRSSGHP